MAGKSYYKVREWDGLYGAAGPYWQRIKKMYVKTGGTTWTQVRKTYVKVREWDGLYGAAGPYWRKVFDTASNAVYWNNDRPRIRLNSYRSSGYIDAGRVQQMGPPYTNPTSGWPNETIGDYLYGANASDLNNIVSGNGSTIYYKYEWLWNTTGNNNDDSLVNAYTSPVSDVGSVATGPFSGQGDRDRFKNTSTYLGANDGDYWDKNFITFKVTATNSTNLQTSSLSDTVYIVRQRPSGTISMIDAGIATPGTTMSATFTYSDAWYNRSNALESYVEWFAVDSLTDALTTSNRVQQEYLNSFTVTGTTTKTGTTFHNPTLTNKYYIVRLSLNNSHTMPAVITVPGFTPSGAYTVQDNKTAKTSAGNGAFSLSNATKTGRFYDVSLFKRNVSVQISKADNATQYEVQIEGQYDGTNGAYNFSNSSWQVLQTLNAAPYVYESDRSNGILTYSTSVTNYRNYRFTARSRNGTSLNGASYSNNGSSSSYVYVTAADVAPSAPSISNLLTATDSLGSYLTFSMSVSSFGSNGSSYYEYSLNGGSTWQTVGSGYINDTGGKLYGTAGSSINLRVRAINLDDLTGAQSNLLTGTFATQPGLPTSVVVKSFANREGTVFFTSGSNTQSVNVELGYDTFNQFDTLVSYINIGSNTAGKVNLTGANSSSFTYTPYLQSFSGVDKTGNQSTIQSYTGRVLAGGDAMTMNTVTATLNASDQRTIDVSWTLSAGSPTHYVVELYYYNSPFTLLSSKTVSSTSSSIQFTSADGVGYTTVYYAKVIPRYQYATNVYYDALGKVSLNVSSGNNLAAPTSTSIVSMDRLDNTTVRAYIGSSGGSGPYYQLYWISGSTAPSTTNYDAASTTSTVMEDFSFANGVTYYFYIRSSTENLGNTITGGTATAGTYSAYGPSSGAASYTFASPSGGTASISGSTTVGSTLTLSLGTPSASPPASGLTIIWRRNDGGTGGNTFTGGSIMQNGGTTYTIDSPLVGYSSVGYQIRAEVTWNNGVGSQSVNTSPITVTAATVTRTLSFNANGGSGAPNAQTGSDSGSGATITISSTTPTRTGYDFAGWNTNSAGTGTNYSAGGSITLTSDVTLYAKWTAQSTGPTAPTSPSVTAGAITRSFSTSLVRNSNTNKTQYWSSATSQSVTISWTKGTGTGTISTDIKWNQTGTTPSSTDSGTWNGNTGTTQSDSNSGGSTNYYWVRTSDGNGNKSAWVYAGSYTAAAVSMTGLTIRLYRGNGTAFSNPATAPSSTTASGSYTWTGITDRGNPSTGGEGHYAYAAGTLNGTAVSATSSTV